MKDKQQLCSNPNYVPFWERVAYGCGDIGTNLYLQMVASFLLLFYTDYMGISPVWAGVVMLVSRLWDGVNDLIIGTLSDRSGNYKRWMFWGALLSIFTFAATFYNPPFETVGKTVYALITFSVWTVTYTCLGTPVNAMASTITPDARERARLNGVRFPMINIPVLVAMACTAPLAAWFGKRLGNDPLGYTATAALYGVVGFVLVLVCLKFVKERAAVQKKPAGEKTSVRDVFSAFKGNGPAMIMILFFFLHYLGYYTSSGVLVYFCVYVLEDIGFLTYYALCAIIMSFIGMSLAPRIFTKKGVRFTAIVCIIVIDLTFIARFLFQTNTTVVLVSAMIQSLFSGPMTVLAYTMVGDVVAYTKWKRGGENVAVFYSTGIFAQKLAMALSAFFCGAFLTMFGYVANQSQTASAKLGINISYTLLPAVCELILLFVMLAWNLDSHESVNYLKKSVQE